jgi:hypothetical protein
MPYNLVRPLGIALFVALFSACGPNTVSNTKDVFDGAEFWYYDTDDRKMLVEDAMRAIDDRYGALSLKKSRLDLDLSVVTLEALLAEQKAGDISDDMPVEQAAANLNFIDRMQATIARFQDTHFRFFSYNPSPRIALGFEVAFVDGRYQIIALSPDIMRFNALSRSSQDYTSLSVGDEVLAIDGRSPRLLVEELSQYQSSSTKAYAKIRATKALTDRDYVYPQQRLTTWTIKRPDGTTLRIEFPWYMDGQHSRLDARVLLRARGFDETSEFEHIKKTLAALDSRSPYDYTLTNSSGFQARGPLSGMSGIQSWNRSGSTNPAIRTGYIEHQGQRIGVLQIYGFGSPVQKSDEYEDVQFLEPIRAFVKTLKTEQLPLIIDLRSNGGGDPYLAIGMMSIIARPGDRYATTTQSFRVTRRVRQLVESFSVSASLDLTNYDAEQAARYYMKKAVRERAPYTAVYADAKPIEADATVGGYEGKIVAMVTPSCISACDVQAMLFKSSGRVRIVGGHSNGTGAGGRGNKIFDSNSWVDGNQVLELSIPNELFGYPGPVDQLTFEDARDLERLNSENRPVHPDVEYFPVIGDFSDHGKGWLESAVRELSIKPTALTDK